MMAGVKYEEITDKGLTVLTKEGKRLTIEADTIILAIPLIPNTDLLKAMEEKVSQIYTIGDCNKPGLILDAIGDGYRISCSI